MKKVLLTTAITSLILSAYGVHRYLDHRYWCQWWRNSYAEAKTAEARALDLHSRALATGDPVAIKETEAILGGHRATLLSSQEYLIKHCGVF